MASATCEVYVKLPSGKTVTLHVYSGDTIKKMTSEVAKEAEVPEERIRLKYQGKILQPTYTAGYLGVRTETILKAEIIQVKKVKILVQVPSGSTLPIEVDNVSPVEHIKRRLEDAENIPPNQQTLKMSGRVIGNMTQSLMEAGITEGTQITMTKSVLETRTGEENQSKDSEKDKDALEAVMGTFDAAGRNVEVVFSFDTTGSMYSCLSEVRDKLREVCNRLLHDIPHLRIGIIAHGDYCDQTGSYVLRMEDITSDVDALINFVQNVPSTGGGDTPECYEWVLHKAQQMDWSEDSAKALIVIGDALPHSINYTDQHINWHEELNVLKGMGVKVYGVQALNQLSALNFYQQLAEHTGGAYIKFNNFQVIADMFLAVCYREADGGEDGDQLATFMEEVEGEGRMEGDLQEVLQQVAQDPLVAPQETNRYVAEPWWDPTLDHSSPQYTYNQQTDTWSFYTGNSISWPLPAAAAAASPEVTSPDAERPKRASMLRRSLRKLRPKVNSNGTNSSKCSIM